MERIQAAIQKAKEQRESSIAPAAEKPRIPLATENSPLWAKLPILSLDAKRLINHRIVAQSQADPAHVAFDRMRTRFMRTMRQKGWTSVAVTSPSPKCGKTMVAVNLAISLTRQRDCRVVLADIDLRRPRVAEIFSARAEKSIEQYLRGESSIERVFQCYGGNLAVGFSNYPVRDSAELLHSSAATRAVQELRRRLAPDFAIFDVPPMLMTDDVMAFVPNVDCVLLVAAAEATSMNEIDGCVRELSEQTNVLGVVLNKCRYAAEEYGYGYYGHY